MRLLKNLFKWLKSLFTKKTPKEINVGELLNRRELRKLNTIKLSKYNNVTGGKGYFKKVPAIM